MKIKMILSILLLLLFSQAALAEKVKILLHTSDKRNMAMVEQAVDNIIEEYGDNREIILVVNGAAVENFTRALGKPEFVGNLLEQEVEIGVCHMALSRRGIHDEQVLDQVEVLESTGVVTIIRLQQQGYIYIKI